MSLLILCAIVRYTKQVVPNHIRQGSLVPKQPCSRVSTEDRALVAKWEAEGRLWPSPGGANDDWFWIFASVFYHDEHDDELDDDVTLQRRTRGQEGGEGGSESGSESGEGKAATQGPMEVVTNDKMRDHW